MNSAKIRSARRSSARRVVGPARNRRSVWFGRMDLVAGTYGQGGSTPRVEKNVAKMFPS